MNPLLAISTLTIIILMIMVPLIQKNKKKKAFLRNLLYCQKQVPAALLQIKELSNITHFFTEAEERQYTQDHKGLHETATRVIRSRFMAKEKVDSGNIEDFIAKYKECGILRAQNNKLNDAYIKLTTSDRLRMALEEYESIKSAKNYLTESKKCDFINKHSSIVDILSLSFQHNVLLEVILTNTNSTTTEQTLRDFCRDIKRIDELKKEINQKYVWREMEDKSLYFQSVLKYPLSDQQRNAIVLDEDNVLVISSAGSGKTFSLQGKVKYLVEQRHVAPANILLVTFTRKAAESLKERINMEGVTCSTFDALANKIVATATGEKPNICDEKNVNEYVFKQLFQDSEFLKAVTEYLLLGSNNSQTEADAEDTQELVESRKATDRRTILPCMDGHVVFTKSEQERIIGDILAMNGVKYRYEENYENYVATSEHRQYKPDFSIHYTTTETVTITNEDGSTRTETHEAEKRVYLEHFGIGIDGQVPQWFAKEGETRHTATQRYTDGMNWKRSLHRENGTILLETSSADFQLSGNKGIEKKLLKMLSEVGVPLKPLPSKEIIKMMDDSNPQRLRSIKQMVTAFVSLLKGSCKDLDSIIIDLQADILQYKPSLVDILKRKEGKLKHIAQLQKRRDLIILEKIIRPYYQLYQQRLQELHQKDFTDIITEATQYCRTTLPKRYDYILIDEFQDLSIVRYKFIQALRSDTPYRTKLFCVGDDWQSIYRFAGSDISLFNNFSSYFGFAEECKIETTYRFGEPLASLSSDFILANPLQRKKQVKCLESAHTDITCMPIIHDKRFNKGTVSNVSRVISHIMRSIPPDKKVYFLGRYGFDVNTLTEAGIAVRIQGERPYIILNHRECPFLTVHQSKGLEADYVILLNCNSGTYGFPSTIEDDPVLSYVLSSSDQFRFSEERRLFYVAITRSSKHTYVLYDEKKPSIFLNKFINETQPQYGYCPLCKGGHRVKFQEKTVRNGNTMIEYRCSNERFGCMYNKIEWINSIPPPSTNTSTTTMYNITRSKYNYRNS